MPICVGGSRDGEIVEMVDNKKIFHWIDCEDNTTYRHYINNMLTMTYKMVSYELMPFKGDTDRFYVWVPVGQSAAETMSILIYNYKGRK